MTDALIPLLYVTLVVGVSGRRGNVSETGGEARVDGDAVGLARKRIWSVTSFLAVAEGINLDISSLDDDILTHRVPPFVLYSIIDVTLDTVSLFQSMLAAVIGGGSFADANSVIPSSNIIVHSVSANKIFFINPNSSRNKQSKNKQICRYIILYHYLIYRNSCALT